MGIPRPMPEKPNNVLIAAEEKTLERAREAAELLAKTLDANNALLHREPLAAPDVFIKDMTVEFANLLIHRKLLL